ncbi:MAG: hypothetical protein JO033_04820 [Acidobacteriaceae bacterium]|nr:hypothetical protein [Acidobacteriaceae bacterium]MBV9179856.1 hypothetical protein [Acidobacteriota bacterium]
MRGYSRQEVLDLIRRADFSVERVVSGTKRHYGRDHLGSFLLAMWEAATKPHGARIMFFTSVEKYAKHANDKSERAARYNLRDLEDTGVIVLKQEANTTDEQGVFMHTARHELNLDELNRRCRQPMARGAEPAPAPEAKPRPEKCEPHTLTSRAARQFMGEVKRLEAGNEHAIAAEQYRAPLPFPEAFLKVCAAWSLDPVRARRRLVYWGFVFPDP